MKYLFTGRYSIPVDKQKEMEDFFDKFDRIPLDEPYSGRGFNLFHQFYLSMYPLLSKSFHKRFSDECNARVALTEKHLDNLRKGKSEPA